MTEKNISSEEACKKEIYSFPRPYYEPPYDSPIEDEFAYHIVKYLDANVQIIKQYKVKTFCANYRLDFLLTDNNGWNIGIECDGAKYHNRDKDRIRDTLILGSNAISTIFRINGRNIKNNINDCLWLIANFNPILFSERGLRNLDVLASETTKGMNIVYAPFILVRHEPENDEEYWEISLEIRSLNETDYYCYMFKEYWEIVKYNHLRTVDQIEQYFSDIPAKIDAHFEMLNGFNNEQRSAYRCLMKDIQIILYGGVK
jgi:very-short-patch-repair endonuclease